MGDSTEAGPTASIDSLSQAPVSGKGGSATGRATSTRNDGDTNIKGKKPDDEDEQAGTNKDTEDVSHLEGYTDKGATTKDAGERKITDFSELDTGANVGMRYPLLDVEPNTISSQNTEDWDIPMRARAKKHHLDFYSLAYESAVGNMQGHKRAYNSKKYGELRPVVNVPMKEKPHQKFYYHVNGDSLYDSLAEAPFGFHKVNETLASQFKLESREKIRVRSADHGGANIYAMGMNQFRNKTILHPVLDPSPDQVPLQTMCAKNQFRLNDMIIYAAPMQRLQFKARYNALRGAEADGRGFASVQGQQGTTEGFFNTPATGPQGPEAAQYHGHTGFFGQTPGSFFQGGDPLAGGPASAAFVAGVGGTQAGPLATPAGNPDNGNVQPGI